MHARAKRKRSRAAVLSGKTEDTLACLHGAVNGVAEKRKDREHPENVLNVQYPVFFWAAHRLAASACPCVYLHIKVLLQALQHFPSGRAAFSFMVF
jgi:hypothetical protein